MTAAHVHDWVLYRRERGGFTLRYRCDCGWRRVERFGPDGVLHRYEERPAYRPRGRPAIVVRVLHVGLDQRASDALDTLQSARSADPEAAIVRDALVDAAQVLAGTPQDQTPLQAKRDQP